MKFNGTQYYYQGYSSHQTGLPYESSNYPMGDQARLEWCRGWRDAENDSRKRLTSTETDNANQQFESLACKPDEVWNGDGLPPVGTECECKVTVNWFRCKVMYISKKCSVLKYGESEQAWFTSSCQFRPIRTEADRKRDEFAKSLCTHLDNLTEWDSPVGKVHALAIYDAIADGKIHGAKLEIPHE